MKALALKAYLDALKARVRAINERTAIARLARLNTVFGRKLPMEYLDDDEGAADEATVAALLASVGGGTTGPADDTAGSGSGGPTTAAAPSSARPASSGHAATVAARGPVAATSVGRSAAQAPRPIVRRWPTAAVIATTAASTLGLGGVASLLLHQHDQAPPQANETVIVQPPQSLYQYLEDTGYHLPPNDGRTD